jgi:hypothetical protein
VRAGRLKLPPPFRQQILSYVLLFYLAPAEHPGLLPSASKDIAYCYGKQRRKSPSFQGQDGRSGMAQGSRAMPARYDRRAMPTLTIVGFLYKPPDDAEAKANRFCIDPTNLIDQLICVLVGAYGQLLRIMKARIAQQQEH